MDWFVNVALTAAFSPSSPLKFAPPRLFWRLRALLPTGGGSTLSPAGAAWFFAASARLRSSDSGATWSPSPLRSSDCSRRRRCERSSFSSSSSSSSEESPCAGWDRKTSTRILYSPPYITLLAALYFSTRRPIILYYQPTSSSSCLGAECQPPLTESFMRCDNRVKDFASNCTRSLLMSSAHLLR